MPRNTSVFEELSQNLSADERNKLLERIHVSLNLKGSNKSAVVYKKEDKTDRSNRIRNDIFRSGAFTQFQLWVGSLFTSRSIEERFVRIKTNYLIKKIQKTDSNLIEADGEYIGSFLARRVDVLRMHSEKLKPFFQQIWSDDYHVAELAAHIAETYIPDPKTDLFDFVEKEKLQNEFVQHMSTNYSTTTVLRALEDYISSVHPQVFEAVAADLSPLYYLKAAIQFPYDELLTYFKGKEGFHGARFQTIRSLLEQLYYATYLATRWSGNQSRVSPIIVKNSSDIAQQMQAFSIAVTRFFMEVPLAELIKVGTLDPYYRFMVYVPRLDIKRFLLAYIKLSLMQQYEQIIPEIRMGTIRKKIDEILIPGWNNSLINLMEYQSPPDADPGNSVIHRVYTLGLYTYYVESIFSKTHEELAVVISRVQARRIRQTSNDMLMVLSHIDDIADRIKRMNQSLSADSSEGEALRRMRLLLHRDTVAQRQYRTQINQIDKLAHELSVRAVETLKALKDQFALHSKESGQLQRHFKQKVHDQIVWLERFIQLLQLVSIVEDENVMEIQAYLHQ